MHKRRAWKSQILHLRRLLYYKTLYINQISNPLWIYAYYKKKVQNWKDSVSEIKSDWDRQKSCMKGR